MAHCKSCSNTMEVRKRKLEASITRILDDHSDLDGRLAAVKAAADIMVPGHSPIDVFAPEWFNLGQGRHPGRDTPEYARQAELGGKDNEIRYCALGILAESGNQHAIELILRHGISGSNDQIGRQIRTLSGIADERCFDKLLNHLTDQSPWYADWICAGLARFLSLNGRVLGSETLERAASLKASMTRTWDDGSSRTYPIDCGLNKLVASELAGRRRN